MGFSGGKRLYLFDHEVTGYVHGAAGGSTHQEIVQEKETDKQRGAEVSVQLQ